MLPKDVDPNRIPDADLFVTDIGIYPKIDSQYDEIHDEITHRDLGPRARPAARLRLPAREDLRAVAALIQKT